MIALLTAWDAKLNAFAELTNPNKTEYCKRWGYEHVTAVPDTLPYNCGGWYRHFKLRELLPQYEAVVVMDLDMLIMNQTIPLTKFLDDPAEVGTTHDQSGINIGFYYFKNTPWAKGLLARWIDVGLYNDKYIAYAADQFALAHCLMAEPREKWRIWSQKDANAYVHAVYGLNNPAGEYEPGDFVVHFPGMDMEKRTSLCKDFLTGVIRETRRMV